MSKKDLLSHVLSVEQELSESMRKPLVEPSAFLKWKGINMISPGTLNTIQGKAGSFKSRLAQEIAMELLTNPDCKNANRLELVKIEHVLIMVAYVDSERNSIYELPAALKSIAENSCLTIPHPMFRYTSIRDIDRSNRKYATEVFINNIRKDYDGELCIIVDVATDLILDFNSVNETGEILDLFKLWMNKYNCAIIAIIHENPKGDKMRGHLGTELLNKASVAMQVSLDEIDETIAIKFMKCRSYKRPGIISVTFDEGTGRLVKENRIQPKKAKDQFTELLERMFSENPRRAREELIQAGKSINRGEDSIDKYLDRIQTLEINGRAYKLHKLKDGRKTVYEAILIDSLDEIEVIEE